MASAKNKETVTAEILKTLKAELDKRATREERSRSQVIGRAIRFYLDHAEFARASDEKPRIKQGET